jgi:hypothetical protein
MRLLACFVIALCCIPAHAAVTCEQLAEIAAATQRLRDEGNAMATVLVEADKLAFTNKFTAAEIENIRIVVMQAFNGGGRYPYDLLQSCREKLRK